MTDWPARYLALAGHIAGWSKDPSTHVGCVVVSADNAILATGYNGLPRGVADLPERMERPAKYLWTSHAEENAVAHAARLGATLKGAAAYVTHHPCSRCARMLIQAGIARVVIGPGKTSMPAEEFRCAAVMFREAGIAVERKEKAGPVSLVERISREAWATWDASDEIVLIGDDSEKEAQ